MEVASVDEEYDDIYMGDKSSQSFPNGRGLKK